MDGTYQVPQRKNAVMHAARLSNGGVETFCGRGYPRDENFSPAPRTVTCKVCRQKLRIKPEQPGAWHGPTVYATRGDLLTLGGLKAINTALVPLALFAELQADGTLRVLDYRHLPDQAAALAEVVARTIRPATK